ncbi:MAG TPA: lipid-A-disaccharide synthase [Bacteriovoracaceae bacterium]|nr:lipid-A-disaccharide synthase [Bacteriovoracaceae bacterium]
MDSCLLVAGEKSGEEHALSFFPELVKLCPDVKFYGVGGDGLQRNGLELLYHLRDFGSMGFSEVVQKIPFYLKAMRRLEAEVQSRGTRTAIVVDFQDFNLRLARRLASRGVKVLYYVAPQAWAWRAGRAGVLARTAHTLFSILPFETQWFKQRGVSQVRSIPHPLMLTYREVLAKIPQKSFTEMQGKLKLLLLPGSRKSEIYSLLPDFIHTVRLLRTSCSVEVHLVKVDHVSEEIYHFYQSDIDVIHHSENLVTAMNSCHMALAASGTVTLSTALFELPTIVCYRSSLLNEFIFDHLIKYRGPISLTNIIHGKMVFPEFTQDRIDPHKLKKIIMSWSGDEKVYTDLKACLRETKNLLSGEDFSVPLYMSQVIHE